MSKLSRERIDSYDQMAPHLRIIFAELIAHIRAVDQELEAKSTALGTIAAQKKFDEMDEEEIDSSDFHAGWDSLIDVARAATSPK